MAFTGRTTEKISTIGKANLCGGNAKKNEGRKKSKGRGKKIGFTKGTLVARESEKRKTLVQVKASTWGGGERKRKNRKGGRKGDPIGRVPRKGGTKEKKKTQGDRG